MKNILKKSLAVLLSLLLVISLAVVGVSALTSDANEKISVGTIFEISGINYKVTSDKTVCVNSGTPDNNGLIDIPDEVNYEDNLFKVTAIRSYAFKYCDTLIEIKIPNSVKSIGKFAFYLCTSLDNVVIPDSIQTIEEDTFFNCTSLKNITIPNSVTTIKSEAFRECTSLNNVTIPNSVTSIQKDAFTSCSSLQSIVIPNSITTIEIGVFSGCKSLESVKIPNSVTSIKNHAFNYCISLKVVMIPESVTEIKNEAFANCRALESIIIPKSVTNLEGRAFSNCSNVTIYGYRSSNLDQFAQVRNLGFRAIETMEKDEITNIGVLDSQALSLLIDEVHFQSKISEYDKNLKDEKAIKMYNINVMRFSPDSIMSLVKIPCNNRKANVYEVESDNSLKYVQSSYSDYGLWFFTKDYGTYIVTVPYYLDVTVGDVDNDGVISVKDSTFIQMKSAGMVTFNKKQFEAADVNNDDLITVFDATRVQKRVARIIDKF